jgi:2-phospho-L-lactate guanylyltransferase
MKTFALVPVKELGAAKSRLQECLSPDCRSGILIAMLRDVLEALEGLSIIVISPEDISCMLDDNIIFRKQTRGRNLNNAVQEANEFAIDLGADSTLFVPADMPLMDKKDVAKVLEVGKEHNVVITKAYDGGTGILFRRPPDIMDSCFTENSFNDHLHKARRSGLRPFILTRDHLSFDIDTRDDLEELIKLGRGTHTQKFLIQNQIQGIVANNDI